jgi:2'-5' RNA ligase
LPRGLKIRILPRSLATPETIVMPRIFTGLELPPLIGQSLATLRGGVPGARWIDAENYHITLRFIGDVDDALAREIALLLGQVRRRSFEIKLDGLSAFGGRKPRAIIASVAASQALMELQAEHERLMQRVGLVPEGRKYTPHVTLARLRDSSSHHVATYLAERGLFRTPPFDVSGFVLFSARASVGGGPYLVEASYPLAA